MKAADVSASAPAKRSRLPGFHTTATDHIERNHRDTLTRRRVQLRNAFTPAQPVVNAQMFAGRVATLEAMIGAIEDKRSHLIIYGERGVGKTSLLHMLTAAARDARYIVVYFSCGATSNFSETFRTVAAELPLLYHSSVSPVSSESDAGTTLVDILEPGPLSPRQFSDAASRLVGTRVLVVLDEFDRAQSSDFRRDVAELIKSLSDLSARLQLVVAGVAPDLSELMEYIPSIRRNISAYHITGMSEDEVRELVRNGQTAGEVEFSPDAVNLIVASARGSPYLCNLLCHLAGMIALSAGRTTVEQIDVVDALDETLQDFSRKIPSEIAPHLGVLTEVVATAERRGEVAQAGENLSLKLQQKLESLGLLSSSQAAQRQALLVDSLKPYLQLIITRSTVEHDTVNARARK